MNNALLSRAAVVLTALSLFGCSLPDLKQRDAEAKQFARGVIDGQIGKWDSSKISPIFEPQKAVSPKDLDSVFQKYDEIVGPIKTVRKLSSSGFRANVGTGPDYVASYNAEITCEKAEGTAAMVVIHHSNKWYLDSLFLNSDAFEKMGSADRKDAEQFVQECSSDLCNGWKFETLQKFADTALAAELNKDALMVKMLMSFKPLGAFKKCTKYKFVNQMISNGETLYAYDVRAQFAHGNATLHEIVLKQDGKWRLRRFQVEAHSK